MSALQKPKLSGKHDLREMNSRQSENFKKRFEIGYSYATSPHAEQWGYKKGCYFVKRLHDDFIVAHCESLDALMYSFYKEYNVLPND